MLKKNSFFDNLKESITPLQKYIKEQEKKIKKSPKKQLSFFILGFVLFYLIFTTILIPFQLPIKNFTGEIVVGFLSVQGMEIEKNGFVLDEFGEEMYSFTLIGNETRETQKFFISWLCTGILEIIILLGAIFASFGVSWKDKLKGMGGAIIIGIIFNFIRIWLTINIFVLTNAETTNIAHDLLFRLVLFIYISAYYIIWFNYTQRK